MFWERWIPESALTKSSVIGIECIVGDNTLYRYTLLSKKKSQVEIIQSGIVNQVNELFPLAKKHSAPFSLVVTGKGIITKRIIFSANDTLDVPALIQQHLPAINANEFYVQFYKNANNTGHLAICRKVVIDDVLSQLTASGHECVNVYISPCVVNAIAAVAKDYNRLTTGDSELELVNGEVDAIKPKSEERLQLQIENLSISDEQVLCFAAGFAYFTRQTVFETNDLQMISMPQKHLEKLKLRVLVMSLIAVVFVISAINSVLYFQRFEQNSALDLELGLYESKNAKITELLESYQKKKSLIEEAGILENKRLALYADKIAASLPQDIVLRELYFNPQEGDAEEDSMLVFSSGGLIIKGNCNKSLLLNEWINVLKSQQFVKSVNLENFIFNSEGHQPNFLLKLETK